VGDGDSADPETLLWLEEKGVPRLFLPREKDETDYQVLLHRIASLGESVRTIVVTGIWGGRFDHLYSALGISVGFLARETFPLLALGDSEEVLFFLCSGESLELRFASSPSVFSLLPLSESCEGVTSRGTKWDLTDVALSRHCPYAISNEILRESENCTVILKRGILGVYAWWE
jgi:thiamine pyrophosphokinase